MEKIRFFCWIACIFMIAGCSKGQDRGKKDSSIVTFRGIDVSHFQGTVDWGQVKKDKIVFAMAKASEGITDIDPDFQENWKGMKEVGLIRGAYHFYIAEDDPLKQASVFLDQIKSLGRNDLSPVLDLERGGYAQKYHIAKEVYQKKVLTWLKRVEVVTGRKPLIYTNYEFANQNLNEGEFKNYKLWLAEYVKGEPEVPEIWGSRGYTFWQKSSSEELNGVKGKVDYNLFRGTVKEFRALTGR